MSVVQTRDIEDYYQVFPLILNSSNLVNDNGQNNTFRYTFPRGSVKFENSKIAIENISLYYSWQNITASYGNNSYQFTFTTGGGTATYTVTMPDGFYSVDELNTYLQNYCVLNNLYLVDGSGDFVYYLQISTNPAYYAVELTTYAFPTALPAGWSNPAGLTFPAVASTPQFIINSNAFRDIIGFSAGTYPSVIQATNYSVLSDSVPQVSPVQSVIVACSLLNNRFANPNTVLYTFSPANVTYGSIINIEPKEYAYIDIQDGLYPSFDISFLDQNFSALRLIDTNLVITVLCKSRINKF